MIQIILSMRFLKTLITESSISMRHLGRSATGISNDNKKTWITRGILTSIKKLNNLFSKFKEAKSNIVKSRLQQLIKKYRNSIVALTRLSKKNRFTKIFLDNSKNLRQTWNGIKSLLNINSKRRFFPSCISKGEKTITNKNEIAEELNCFFTSIASELQDKIHHFHTDFNKYLKTPSINSMFVQQTDEYEIFLLISRMESKKTARFSPRPSFIFNIY